MADDAWQEEDGPTGAPSLVEPDEGWLPDDEAQVVATEAGGDPELSAEEAALHVTSEDEAPGLSWADSPGYVDG